MTAPGPSPPPPPWCVRITADQKRANSRAWPSQPFEPAEAGPARVSAASTAPSLHARNSHGNAVDAKPRAAPAGLSFVWPGPATGSCVATAYRRGSHRRAPGPGAQGWRPRSSASGPWPAPIAPPQRSRSTAGCSCAICALERWARYGRRRCRALTDGGLTPSVCGPDGRDRPVRFRGVSRNRVSNRVENRGRRSVKSKHIVLMQHVTQRSWRRDGDSNPGHLSVNTLSRRAP